MDRSNHDMNTLFAQLGLPNSDQDIEKFIAQHQIEGARIELQSAPFWNASQAEFIREALQADSDWAERVDELNNRLHQ